MIQEEELCKYDIMHRWNLLGRGKASLLHFHFLKSETDLCCFFYQPVIWRANTGFGNRTWFLPQTKESSTYIFQSNFKLTWVRDVLFCSCCSYFTFHGVLNLSVNQWLRKRKSTSGWRNKNEDSAVTLCLGPYSRN